MVYNNILHMSKKVKIKHTYEIKFINKNTGDLEEIKVNNIDNKTVAYDEARGELCKKYNLSISSFESDWTLKLCKHYLSFKNKPWNTKSELEQDL